MTDDKQMPELLIEPIAAIIEPLAFIGSDIEIRQYCSPETVEDVQNEVILKAKLVVNCVIRQLGQTPGSELVAALEEIIKVFETIKNQAFSIPAPSMDTPVITGTCIYGISKVHRILEALQAPKQPSVDVREQNKGEVE